MEAPLGSSKDKLDIVCVAFPSWHGNYVKSTVQLMKELALRHNVLYIDYAYTWKDVFKSLLKKKSVPVKRILGISKRLYEIQLSENGKINILSLPPVVPLNWVNNPITFSRLTTINAMVTTPLIRRAIKKLGMKKPIVVNAFNPVMGVYLTGKLNEKALIYYCYDNIAATRWAGKHGDISEKKFLKNVDACIFTSTQLKQEKHLGNIPSYVINNGVDTKLFNAYTIKENAGIQKNIAYVGSIDVRLDYELIKQVISMRPEWKFHFIGRIEEKPKSILSSLNNVQLYGAIDVSGLPALMSTMDAGIIPFIKDDFTRNIYPMKVNEYLAVGMPVVMTSFAPLPDLSSVTLRADNANEFVAGLEKGMIYDTAIINNRKAFASANSWTSKAAEFEKVLIAYAH